MPEAGKEAHDWATNVLPATVFSEKNRSAWPKPSISKPSPSRSRARRRGAGGAEPRAQPAFPNTICGVVYQNEDWRNRCQFSFACDRIPDIIWSRSRFEAAKEVALAVTAGKIYLKEVGDSTHYHAVYVRPNWARTMKRVSRIGLHIFYRTYRGGWV